MNRSSAASRMSGFSMSTTCAQPARSSCHGTRNSGMRDAALSWLVWNLPNGVRGITAPASAAAAAPSPPAFVSSAAPDGFAG